MKIAVLILALLVSSCPGLKIRGEHEYEGNVYTNPDNVVSIKAPNMISLVSFDEGEGHDWLCESWRGCWAYHDEYGWIRFRYGDYVSWPWTPGSYSLWRCHCGQRGKSRNGHLPSSPRYQPNRPLPKPTL